jgi:hypothetical protein
VYKSLTRLGIPLILLCFIGFLGLNQAFFTSQAILVWWDDFNDGNHSGWMILGAIDTGPDYVLGSGNFSAADGTLLCTGPNLNIAFYDSSVAYGTWSFDVLVVPGSKRFIMIIFIGDNYDINDYVSNGYVLTIGLGNYGGEVEPTFFFEERDNLQWIEHDRWTLSNIEGWQSIMITRNRLGEFNIHINGTLRMSGVDNSMTNSIFFYFICQEGQALDNVFVSDDGPPPTPLPIFLLMGIVTIIVLFMGATFFWERTRGTN